MNICDAGPLPEISKCLFIVYNFIFVIFGCVVIGVGASTLVDFGYYVALSSLLPYATATKVSIAAGILMTAVVFLGCWGAWKENRFLLIIFYICVIVILGLEIASGQLENKYHDKVENTLDKDFLAELRQHYNESESEGTTKGIDTLQGKFVITIGLIIIFYYQALRDYCCYSGGAYTVAS